MENSNCFHPAFRFLDCAECAEAGETCNMRVCVECGIDLETLPKKLFQVVAQWGTTNIRQVYTVEAFNESLALEKFPNRKVYQVTEMEKANG